MTTTTSPPVQLVAVLLAVAGGLLPLAGYWTLAGEPAFAAAWFGISSHPSGDEAIPFRSSPPVEEWAAVFTGFVVKPLYTLLSLALVVVLWRQNAPDLVALRWAMLCFFVGENFCAANYFIGGEQSLLLEYLHSYGMVLCFGLTTFALLEGIDQRLIRLSDPQGRCAALGLCHRCIKHADAPCGLRRVFQFLIPAMAIVALAPFTAYVVPTSYDTTILGTPYNYSHPVLCQVFEKRYLPAAAVGLFVVSWGVLQYARRDAVLWSKIFFSAGVGAIGFSFFRLVAFHAYRDNLAWFGAWEEVTELLFILGVGAVLWVFRATVLPEFPYSGTRRRRWPVGKER
jgi:hypothetical protein